MTDSGSVDPGSNPGGAILSNRRFVYRMGNHVSPNKSPFLNLDENLRGLTEQLCEGEISITITEQGCEQSDFARLSNRLNFERGHEHRRAIFFRNIFIFCFFYFIERIWHGI